MKHVVNVGQRFGQLVVVDPSTKVLTSGGNVSYATECRCDCGATSYPTARSLHTGRAKSCGCSRKGRAGRKPKPGRIKEGGRFGRLVVLRRYDPDRWLCRCDCGRHHAPRASNLLSGATTSCGCYSAELTRVRATKHGRYSGGHICPVMRRWKRLEKLHQDNGGVLCNEWLDFAAFEAWFGNQPDGARLLRIDTGSAFGPTNCKIEVTK